MSQNPAAHHLMDPRRAPAPLPGRLTASAAAVRRAARASARSWALPAVAAGTPLLLSAAWWSVSAGSTNTFFPPLEQILARFRELWVFAQFASDVVPSLSNLVVGFAVAAVLGVALGAVLGLNRTASELLDPIVHFWRAIPPVALVPIIVALFGFGNETRVLSIAIAAVFPTLIATVDGLHSIEPLVKDMARVYQLAPLERLRDVYLPGAAPRIAAGLRVSLQTAFVVMIASEMLGSTTGIGARTLLAQQSFAIADMWAGILLLGIIGFAANATFEAAERRALRWYAGLQAQARAN